MHASHSSLLELHLGSQRKLSRPRIVVETANSQCRLSYNAHTFVRIFVLRPLYGKQRDYSAVCGIL